MKKSNTEVKVMAMNILNKYSKQAISYYNDMLTPFIGKDIFKVDGSIKKKYDFDRFSYEGKDPEGNHISVQSWITINRGWVELTVKICINGGSYDVQPTTAFCQYENRTFDIFSIEPATGYLIPATREEDRTYLDTIYNLEDLNKIAADIKQAAEQYRKELDKMPYYFKDVYYLERLTQ